MACECTEQEESSGTHCLVYTIGTEDAFYRMIEATLPGTWTLWQSRPLAGMGP